jgi:hypothetical protein
VQKEAGRQKSQRTWILFRGSMSRDSGLQNASCQTKAFRERPNLIETVIVSYADRDHKDVQQ